jgi:DNA-binding transcriptional MerR regulator
MYTIGDLARLGRVSVRMLRHYDAIGLLPPAAVDDATGYRYYVAGQLARLNRIVALKDLGFSLEQVRSVLDEKIGTEEMRGMLRLRRAELAGQIAADTERLAQVEVRLRIIEEEGIMPPDDIHVKSIPALRVAELSAGAASFEPEAITPVIGPLYDRLLQALGRAGVAPAGPGVAYYEPTADGAVVVHAAVPVNVGDATGLGLTVVDLPPIERAATVIHRGSMDEVMPTLQTLARWIDDHGYRSAGPNRELYLDADGDRATWVTELQEPIETR